MIDFTKQRVITRTLGAFACAAGLALVATGVSAQPSPDPEPPIMVGCALWVDTCKGPSSPCSDWGRNACTTDPTNDDNCVAAVAQPCRTQEMADLGCSGENKFCE